MKVFNSFNSYDASHYYTNIKQSMLDAAGIEDGITGLRKGEVNLEESKTVPDETMPLREIITRFQRGGDVQIFPGEFLLKGDSADFDHVLAKIDFGAMDSHDKIDFFKEMELRIRRDAKNLKSIREKKKELQMKVDAMDKAKAELEKLRTPRNLSEENREQ